MKTIVTSLLLAVLFATAFTTQAQDLADAYDLAEYTVEIPSARNTQPNVGDNGFSFETFQTGINSKYSDYGVGFFRNKFISYSARKIGALAKIDSRTDEPYTKLYCSDITEDYDLERPLLFSSLLNKNENLGTLSFADNGNVLFFTKSKEYDSRSFDLYRAEMNPERKGQWINLTKMNFNGESYSVENPHVSSDGKSLFFASNSDEAIGGFDIFKVRLNNNKPYGAPRRVEGSVNTVLDEKFPQTSLDGKYLFFSSKGHDSKGGYDIFRSRKARLGYVSIRNLGNTINTEQDEIAYIQATPSIGYLTSNRHGGKGSYDIYKLKENLLTLTVTGKVLDSETAIPLEAATVVLLDENGEEAATMRTAEDGSYTFSVDAFAKYTILSYKNKFERSSVSLTTNVREDTVFNKDLILTAEPAPIVVMEKKTVIQIDNIQFDYDSASIKSLSTITLNTVVATLNNNPDIRIAIKAHTDAQGSKAYNLKLSDKRAAAAMNYLMDKGISLDRLSSEGFGESQPLINCGQNCTQENYEMNRRVEFEVVKN